MSLEKDKLVLSLGWYFKTDKAETTLCWCNLTSHWKIFLSVNSLSKTIKNRMTQHLLIYLIELSLYAWEMFNNKTNSTLKIALWMFWKLEKQAWLHPFCNHWPLAWPLKIIWAKYVNDIFHLYDIQFSMWAHKLSELYRIMSLILHYQEQFRNKL